MIFQWPEVVQSLNGLVFKYHLNTGLNLVWYSDHHLNNKPVFEWWSEYRTTICLGLRWVKEPKALVDYLMQETSNLRNNEWGVIRQCLDYFVFWTFTGTFSIKVCWDLSAWGIAATAVSIIRRAEHTHFYSAKVESCMQLQYNCNGKLGLNEQDL